MSWGHLNEDVERSDVMLDNERSEGAFRYESVQSASKHGFQIVFTLRAELVAQQDDPSHLLGIFRPLRNSSLFAKMVEDTLEKFKLVRAERRGRVQMAYKHDGRIPVTKRNVTQSTLSYR